MEDNLPDQFVETLHATSDNPVIQTIRQIPILLRGESVDTHGRAYLQIHNTIIMEYDIPGKYKSPETKK